MAEPTQTLAAALVVASQPVKDLIIHTIMSSPCLSKNERKTLANRVENIVRSGGHTAGRAVASKAGDKQVDIYLDLVDVAHDATAELRAAVMEADLSDANVGAVLQEAGVMIVMARNFYDSVREQVPALFKELAEKTRIPVCPADTAAPSKSETVVAAVESDLPVDPDAWKSMFLEDVSKQFYIDWRCQKRLTIRFKAVPKKNHSMKE